MADSKEKLFSDFPAVSTEQWMEKITADLKGADFEKKLVWRTNEGFKVKPFYRQEDLEGLKTTEGLPGEFPYVRGTKKNDNTWFVRQEIKVECPKEANAKALDILNKGVDSLGFYVKKKDLSPEYIETLLNDICAECIELNFSTCQGHTVELAQLLVAYFQKKGYDLTKLQGSVNYDPMGKMMVKGKDLSNFITTAKELVEVLAPLPKFRCICVNAIELNNAGSYISQELGYALAWGNEYLSKLVEAGVPAALAAKKIKFNFGISSNYFLEIAKFRAARMLWADIVKEYHPQCNRQPECPNKAEDGTCLCACKMVAHAETSTFNLTLFDAHVNLLRTQTEAMSAALAGVNSITVTPFDKTYETPDDFSERIARNQQLLLKEECHFNKVVDPAAGSYFIENLTISIATQAWELFLKVEDEGGMLEAVKAGKVQEAINASNKARHDSVSKRKEILLGTNQYPNFNEKAGEKANLGCFIPMQYKISIRRGRKVRALVPVIRNLVFVHARPSEVQRFKSQITYLQYITDTRSGQKIIIPDHDMQRFIAVAGTYNDHLLYFQPEELNLSKGTKVRITGGDFEGQEGVFLKVKGARDRRVVIAIQGIIAVAMATIHPDLIEVIK